MTREEKEQTGKYVLQMARLLEDRCYQQEMLLKAVHIIDEALEQDPTDRIEYGTDGNLYKLTISNGKEFETGHWIYSHNNLFGINIFKCSKCNWDGDAADYNYCPNCGARMESEE